MIIPATDMLWCKSDQPENKTKSGFLVSNGEPARTAVVLGVGKSITDYAIGDSIIYRPYASVEMRIDGEDTFLVGESDIIGVVK